MVRQNLMVLFGGLSGAIIIFALLLRFLPGKGIFGRLMLKTEESAKEGFSIGSPALDGLVGREGKTVTKLRPAGKVEIDDELYDAVAEGVFIEKGETVRVLAVEGNRIVVAKA